MTKHIKAEIDPEKAPQTAENIREYVRNHRAAGLTTTYGELNSNPERDARRKEAIGHLPKRPKMAIDEDRRRAFESWGTHLPRARRQGKRAGVYQGGVLGHAIWKAKTIGKPDTMISYGIKGENLLALEGPAGAARARHAEKKRKMEEIERAAAENS
ncbi:hypothetical protein MaudCBS49596_004948 [Microsporum audouinii]